MSRSPIVSILINCFNEEKFIYRSLKSVINQTFKNWECVVLDDASTDSTINIIKNFKDKRIKVYRNKKNLGLGKSRIKAQKYLKGKYISILDADDFFEKKKIQEQVRILNKYPNVGLISSWTNVLDLKGVQVRKFQSFKNNNELKKNLILVNSLPHSSIMYRSELAKKVGWYSKSYNYAQDYDLTLKILKISDFYLIKKYLTNCTTLGKNMSSIKKYRYVAVKETIDILKKNNSKKLLLNDTNNLINNVININLLKLIMLDTKFNFLVKIIKILKLLILKPSIVLNLFILKKYNEQKKV